MTAAGYQSDDRLSLDDERYLNVGNNICTLVSEDDGRNNFFHTLLTMEFMSTIGDISTAIPLPIQK